MFVKREVFHLIENVVYYIHLHIVYSYYIRIGLYLNIRIRSHIRQFD